MTQCITESLNSLNSQPSRLLFPYGQRTSFRASERDVSLLTLSGERSRSSTTKLLTLNTYCTFHLSNQVSLSERPIHKRR